MHYVIAAVFVPLGAALIVAAVVYVRRFVRSNAAEREALERRLNPHTASARHGTGEGRRRLADARTGAVDVDTLTFRIAQLER